LLQLKQNYLIQGEKMSVIRFRSITLVLIVVMLILSACQPASNGPQIVTSGAWGRPSPKMAMAGAV
jgi:hypothetical protein